MKQPHFVVAAALAGVSPDRLLALKRRCHGGRALPEARNGLKCLGTLQSENWAIHSEQGSKCSRSRRSAAIAHADAVPFRGSVQSGAGGRLSIGDFKWLHVTSGFVDASTACVVLRPGGELCDAKGLASGSQTGAGPIAPCGTTGRGRNGWAVCGKNPTVEGTIPTESWCLDQAPTAGTRRCRRFTRDGIRHKRHKEFPFAAIVPVRPF